MTYRYGRRWLCCALLAACGSDAVGTAADPDAPDVVPPPDAPAVAPVDFDSYEGGEVRLEYLNFPAANAPLANRTRALAFFWDGPKGNNWHQLFAVPGCTDWGTVAQGVVDPSRWPFTREPTSQLLDVGQVIISGGKNQLNLNAVTPIPGKCSVTTGTSCFQNAECPATETCGGFIANSGTCSVTTTTLCTTSADCLPQEICKNAIALPFGTRDNIGRLYEQPWRFTGEAPGTKLDNVGDKYVSPDTTYDLIFTGSPSWPAQILKDALYLPEAWTPVDPPVDVIPALVADQDLVITYDTPTQLNKPPGYAENMNVHFIAGRDTFLVTCSTDDTTTGTITIPAAVINKVRALAPNGGKFVRQHTSHHFSELTDGVTHNNKRIDVIGIWCYPYTFTVAP